MPVYKLMKYWLPVGLWMTVIFWMSTDTFSPEHSSEIIEPAIHWLFPWIAKLDLDLIHAVIRKIAHVVEYFILGLLLFRAYRGDSPLVWDRKWTMYTLIVVILYAMSDEFHQNFVPSRTASLYDVGLNTLGGIFSQMSVMLWYRIRQPGTGIRPILGDEAEH